MIENKQHVQIPALKAEEAGGRSTLRLEEIRIKLEEYTTVIRNSTIGKERYGFS